VAEFIGVMNLIPGAQEDRSILVGQSVLPAPQTYQGKVTIAVRPEDLALVSASESNAWKGSVEQIVDLGHYRKGLITIPTTMSETIKIYLPKTSPVKVGDQVSLLPTRYLVYHEGKSPVEVRLDSPEPAPLRN